MLKVVIHVSPAATSKSLSWDMFLMRLPFPFLLFLFFLFPSFLSLLSLALACLALSAGLALKIFLKVAGSDILKDPFNSLSAMDGRDHPLKN